MTQLQNPITAAQGMFLAAIKPQVRAVFTVSNSTVTASDCHTANQQTPDER